MSMESPVTRLVPNEEIMRDIKQLIGEGTSVEIRCKGNSMNPFFVSGRDTLVLSPFKPSDIIPGSVILGRDSRGIYLVHRVVAVKDGVLTLNGDGNLVTSLEKVRDTDVIAILSGYIRNGERGYTMPQTVLSKGEGDADVPVTVCASREWTRYSSAWKAASWLRLGSWSLRRIFLGFWRRRHPDWILRTGRPSRTQ